jgi:hypothetical protein
MAWRTRIAREKPRHTGGDLLSSRENPLSTEGKIMNRSSTATSCMVLLVAGFCAPPIAAAKDYPPTTELKDQVRVAEQPDRGSRYGATAVRLITRGYEAIYFSIEPTSGSKASRWFVYDTAQKKITAVSGDLNLPSSGPALQDNWKAMDRWRRYFTPAGRENLLAIEHLEEGFSCHARQGRSPGKPAEIFVDRASTDTARLCALEPYEGRTLHQVHWLRLMPSGCVAVLASDGKVTVLQIYENPMLDAIGAQWNALMNDAYRGEPTVQARYLGSLYDFSEYADRGFDPFLLASDGRVYFGTMPHHSSESAPVFCFAPGQGKLILLGDVARGWDVSCVSMRVGRLLLQPQVAGTRHGPSFRGVRGSLTEFPQAGQRTPHACCLAAMATHANKPPQRKRRPRVLVHSSLSFCSNTGRSPCTRTETWNSVAYGPVHLSGPPSSRPRPTAALGCACGPYESRATARNAAECVQVPQAGLLCFSSYPWAVLHMRLL